MDPFTMAATAATAGASVMSGLGSIFSGQDQARAAKENLRLQRDNLEYQKWAQTQTWAREDNAVQRRALDMKAAGINPLLAAGSAAQSSAPVKTEAPQMDVRAAGGAARGAAEAGGAVSDLGMRALQMKMDFAQKDAAIANMQVQNDLIRAQAEKTRVEANSIANNMPLDVQRKQLENSFAEMANPQRLRSMAFELDQMNPRQLEDLEQQIRGRKAVTLNVQEETLWKQAEGSIRNELTRANVDKAKQELIMQSLRNEFQGRANQIQEWTMPATVSGAYADAFGGFADLLKPKQWQPQKFPEKWTSK